jgi:hypothetical protein
MGKLRSDIEALADGQYVKCAACHAPVGLRDPHELTQGGSVLCGRCASGEQVAMGELPRPQDRGDLELP